MRREELFLVDIVEAADVVREYLDGKTHGGFLQDRMLRDAVLRRLISIGEATSRLSPDFRSRYPEVDWRRVIAFRNFAVHGYFDLDWTVVWDAATVNTPILRQQVFDIFVREFPDSDPPGTGAGARP